MSTLSQLGIMMIITACIIKTITLLHTNTHAIFKALLFITVGRLIEKREGTQKKKMITRQESKTSVQAIKSSSITLIRLPITSRFFSKDLIIETLDQKNKISEALMLLITATLTILYSATMLKEVAKKKKSSERKEGKTRKREMLLSSVMVVSRTIIRQITEIKISITENRERQM